MPELFLNTKSDLGEYNKIYSGYEARKCKNQYDAITDDTEKAKYGYELQTLRFLEGTLALLSSPLLSLFLFSPFLFSSLRKTYTHVPMLQTLFPKRTVKLQGIRRALRTITRMQLQGKKPW